jgi:glucokinase
MISDCAESGDAFCQEVIEETGKWLGTGIAGLIALLNPECIALAGGMIHAGQRLMNSIVATVEEQGLNVPTKRAKIVYSELGEDAGVLGAAGCALSRL